MSTMRRDHARAVLDRLAAAELAVAGGQVTTEPPIWYMPASKLTRVRVLAFSKIIASVRSTSGW
jgi:capsular polysaccharide biosynthesis protein